MARKVLLRSQAIERQSSSQKSEKSDASRDKRQFAELAGGSAADCTIICCCCPWTVMNLVIFAVYRMPLGLCRKAMNRRKRHRRLKRKCLIQQRKAVSQEFEDASVEPALESFEATKQANDAAHGEDMNKLEEEMWGRFNQTGFWRSSSQRHE
ncbi:hypothetical protein SDJN02_15386, partial [Cucurbita argyrosperma subsp. argyrosperma]